MRRFALAILGTLALAGCTDWSRPDPRLRRSAPAAPTPTQPAPAPAPDHAAPATIEALREGVRALRTGGGGAARDDALAEVERLEGLGFDLMERGAPDVQAEAEALLEELSALRAELVDRSRGGG